MKKIALITGSSRGIGAATAICLAKRGYEVCINFSRDGKAAGEVAAAVEHAGGKAIAVKADVSSERAVEGLFREIDERLGRLTALVNNAGILLPQSRVESMTAERINLLMTTNVTGYFLCCREAVKRMSLKHGGAGGAIVNVSSVAARLGAGGEYVDYAATKGAVDTLTTGLAAEVAAEGIRVNCVRPGYIHTDMHAAGGESDRVERLKEVIPMRRGGQPEEVAAAIAWLLSDEASYVTGTFIDPAGGR